MAFLIKIKDKYFEWSTIVDAPITYGMTLEELKTYIKEEYGNSGLKDLPKRLERVELTGTSRRIGSLEGVLSCNRAGPDETNISADEIYKIYSNYEEN